MNVNNSKFIRQASLELYSLDKNNVVKVASWFKRVVNWAKGFSDPEYKESIDKLKEESPKIKYLVDNLSGEISKLTSAINNTDPTQYGTALESVRPIIAELAKELGAFDAAAAEATAKAPADGVMDAQGVVHPESSYLTYVQKGYRQDPETMAKLQKQLPDNLDVPISQRIVQPVQSFAWFKQFSPQDISFSHGAIDMLSGQIKDALITGPRGMDTYESEQIVDSNIKSIISELQNAILNGTLLRYVYPEAGGRSGTRTANLMEFVVNAGQINIPGTEIFLDFPLILLNDRLASANPTKTLEYRLAKNIRYTNNAPQKAPPPPRKEQTKDSLKEELEELDIPIETDLSSMSNRLDLFQKFAATRRLTDAEVTPQLSMIAQKILSKHGPIGKQYGFNFGGNRYLAKIEEHYHPPGGEQKPWGKHPGVSLFITDEKSVVPTRSSTTDKQQVEPVKTKLTTADASAALHGAWVNLFHQEPSPETIAILTAQWSHETGNGQSMYNYNFGGIKGVSPSGLTVKQRTREGWGASEKTIRDNFRAYNTAEEGAEDYLSLLRRKYPRAINAALNGDPTQFVHELKRGGYFTGNEDDYVKSVSRRTQQILSDPASQDAKPPQGQPQMMAQAPQDQTAIPSDAYNAADAEDLFNFLYGMASIGPAERIVRRALYKQKLPTTRAFITIGSSHLPLYARVRYASILISALRVEIDAESSIHNYGDHIEIESDISGSEKNVLSAVKGICEGISEAFELSTEKCGSYKIDTRIVSDAKSSYALIDKNLIESCFRKFAIDMVGHE